MDRDTLDALVAVATTANRLLPLLHARGEITDAQLRTVADAGQRSDLLDDAYHRELRGLAPDESDPDLPLDLAHAAFELAARLANPRLPHARRTPQPTVPGHPG